jgi:hypothetical protein
MRVTPRISMRANAPIALILALVLASSAACGNGSSGGNGATGPFTSGADGASDAGAPGSGAAPDATLPVGFTGTLAGTQTCTVGYSGEPSQQTTTVVSIVPAQVVQTSTSFTATGLTIGPFAGATCDDQTVNAAVQAGATAGSTELVSSDADGGSMAAPCTPTGTDLGPLTVSVGNGYFNPAAQQGQTALYLYLDVTSAADGGAADAGASFTYGDAAVVTITCAFTLMLN